MTYEQIAIINSVQSVAGRMIFIISQRKKKKMLKESNSKHKRNHDKIPDLTQGPTSARPLRPPPVLVVFYPH